MKNFFKYLQCNIEIEGVVVIYDRCQIEGKYNPYEFRVEDHEIYSTHTEIFLKSALNRVILNENSFTLKFENKTLRLFLTDKKQIEQLSDMVQLIFSTGLHVIEHFSKLSIADFEKYDNIE